MALPASGTITLDDLQTEFGGSNPISLSEYYRGGSLVPDTATNSGVPTSGAISLDDFYGAAAGSTLKTVTIGTDGGVNDGFVSGSYGSIDDDDLNGDTIVAVFVSIITGKVSSWSVKIRFSGDTTSSHPFTSVDIETSGTETLARSAAGANYVSGGNYTEYSWNTNSASGAIYNIATHWSSNVGSDREVDFTV